MAKERVNCKTLIAVDFMNQHYSQALGLTRLILMDGKAKRVWLRLAKRMSVDLATVFTCNKRCFGHKVMAVNLF